MGICLISGSCGSTRKYNRSLEGLMIQENTKLRINREFYSRHNIQTRKDAYRKFRKYGRR
jgi:hypothetical protein